MRFFNLLQAWRYLQASYWFIPGVMVVMALVLSVVMLRVDVTLGDEWIRDFDVLFENQAVGARTVLSTIAGSMITVAGVTFSMTVVSVSFAAAQFGPRLVGNFMRDAGNQVTLGIFIATFVYCLMILRTVRSAEDGGPDALTVFVPHASILLALVLALACVAVLIYFIHHIPETINIANITAAVGSQLVRDIEERSPTLDGGHQEERDGVYTADRQPTGPDARSIESDDHGYLQYVDLGLLVALAARHDAWFELARQPGDFVGSGDALLKYRADADLGESAIADVRNTFRLGRNRTPDQDTLFLADELIEIMARALSPGLNDPFTALGCINWLRSALIAMAVRSNPQHLYRDDDGRVRVIARVADFERFASAIFGQSLQYVSADRNAAIRMMNVMHDIVMRTADPAKRAIVAEHAQNLLSATQECLSAVSDQLAMQDEFARFEAAASNPPS